MSGGNAGIGENDPHSRELICKQFEYLGLKFDSEINDGKRGQTVLLSGPDSKVKVMVVPTNEELVIAEDTKIIIEKRQNS
jgi:acetate kinase